MSQAAVAYVLPRSAAPNGEPLSRTEKLVWLVLAERADSSANAVMSLEQLAEQCCCDVMEPLKQLAAKGCVTAAFVGEGSYRFSLPAVTNPRASAHARTRSTSMTPESKNLLPTRDSSDAFSVRESSTKIQGIQGLPALPLHQSQSHSLARVSTVAVTKAGYGRPQIRLPQHLQPYWDAFDRVIGPTINNTKVEMVRARVCQRAYDAKLPPSALELAAKALHIEPGKNGWGEDMVLATAIEMQGGTPPASRHFQRQSQAEKAMQAQRKFQALRARESATDTQEATNGRPLAATGQHALTSGDCDAEWRPAGVARGRVSEVLADVSRQFSDR